VRMTLNHMTTTHTVHVTHLCPKTNSCTEWQHIILWAQKIAFWMCRIVISGFDILVIAFSSELYLPIYKTFINRVKKSTVVWQGWFALANVEAHLHSCNPWRRKGSAKHRSYMVRSMTSELKTEGIRIQIGEKLNEDHVKLWPPPHYSEGGVTIKQEIQVRLTWICLLWLRKGVDEMSARLYNWFIVSTESFWGLRRVYFHNHIMYLKKLTDSSIHTRVCTQ
jgi:hypothetical protein